MEKIFTHRIGKVAIAMVAMILWGSAFAVLKVSYQELQIQSGDYVSKIYLAGLRFFIAGLIAIAYGLIFLREKVKIGNKDIGLIISVGLLQTTLQYIFFYIGVGNTSGVKSAILQSGSTFIVVIMAHFIYKNDRLNLARGIALLLGLGGIIVTNLSGKFDLNFTLTGEGFVLIAVIVSGITTIMIKSWGSQINPIVLNIGQLIAGSLGLILIARLMGATALQWTKLSLALLVYAGFISSTAFTLWYSLLKYNLAGELSVYRLFIPVFGTLISLITIPGEKPTPQIFIGLFMVVMGTWILNRFNNRV